MNTKEKLQHQLKLNKEIMRNNRTRHMSYQEAQCNNENHTGRKSAFVAHILNWHKMQGRHVTTGQVS